MEEWLAFRKDRCDLKVRLRQPVVEARQWDGDLRRMSEWLRSHAATFHASRERNDPSRLRVTETRFTFSLAEGDWLIVSSDGTRLHKVTKDRFESDYEQDMPRWCAAGDPVAREEAEYRHYETPVFVPLTIAAVEWVGETPSELANPKGGA